MNSITFIITHCPISPMHCSSVDSVDQGEMESNQPVSTLQDIAIQLGYQYGILVVAGILFVVLLRRLSKLNGDAGVPAGKMAVPRVGGGLPLIGHLFWVYWHPLRFFKECADKHGPAFVIKLLGKRMMVICDQPTASHLLKKPDEEFSLFQAVVEFAGFDYEFGATAHVFRKSLKIKSEEILPVMQIEIDKMMDSLSASCESSPRGKSLLKNFMGDISRCVGQINYACFMGKDLTNQQWEEFQKLLWRMQALMGAHVILPKVMYEVFLGGVTRRSRAAFLAFTQKLLQEYREDDNKLAQRIMAEEDVLSNEMVGNCIILTHLISADSFHAAFFEAINHLARKRNAKFLSELREECKMNGRFGLKEILQGPLLHACVMESARLGSTLMANVRTPMKPGLTIGDYFVDKGIDWVSLSTPMIMEHWRDAGKTFKNPSQFNPYRFIGEEKESFASNYVVAWGNGPHICPAKLFAIHVTKLFLASFLSAFELELKEEKERGLVISSHNYIDIVISKRVN